MAPEYREYYMLPRKNPADAALKWGGERLIQHVTTYERGYDDEDEGKHTTTTSLSPNASKKPASSEASVIDEPKSHRKEGRPFVYYTDSHYGDDLHAISS